MNPQPDTPGKNLPPVGSSIPEGHAYVTTDGGFFPSTKWVLTTPPRKIEEPIGVHGAQTIKCTALRSGEVYYEDMVDLGPLSSGKDAAFTKAKAWLNEHAPHLPLYAKPIFPL